MRFQLPYHCKYGQRLCLIGSSANLGAWHVDKAVPMEWTEGDVWQCELQLPEAGGGLELEYKYVVRHERDMTAVRWKEGGNFYLQVPPKGQLRVLDTWDDSVHKVEVLEQQALETQQAAATKAAASKAAALQATESKAAAPQAVAARPTAQQAATAKPAAPQVAAQRPAPQATAPQPLAPQAAAPPAVAAQAAAVVGTPPEPQAVTVAASTPAVAPAKRTRRKKVDEDEVAAAAISKAADRAMQQLDSAVSKSLDLLTGTNDPATPELLAADRQVAAAARRAATMNKALDAAKEAKLLPPVATKTRRRKKDSST